MSQPELLKRVATTLEAARVEYMLTGSMVSSLQGEPRSTHDIDIVVAMRPRAAAALVAAFPPPDFYLDAKAIDEAIASGGMFNLIDTRSVEKVDFWLLTDDPFDQQRFLRRQSADLFGMRIPISAPEDTILMKLRWAQQSGGSKKQYGDALRVYEVQHQALDQTYLDAWAGRLGLQAELDRLRREAELA